MSHDRSGFENLHVAADVDVTVHLTSYFNLFDDIPITYKTQNHKQYPLPPFILLLAPTLILCNIRS